MNKTPTNDYPNVYLLSTFLGKDFTYDDLPIAVQDGIYEVQESWGDAPKKTVLTSSQFHLVSDLCTVALAALPALTFFLSLFACAYYSLSLTASLLITFVATVIAAIIACSFLDAPSKILTKMAYDPLLTYLPRGRIAVWGHWTKADFKHMRKDIRVKQELSEKNRAMQAEAIKKEAKAKKLQMARLLRLKDEYVGDVADIENSTMTALGYIVETENERVRNNTFFLDDAEQRVVALNTQAAEVQNPTLNSVLLSYIVEIEKLLEAAHQSEGNIDSRIRVFLTEYIHSASLIVDRCVRLNDDDLSSVSRGSLVDVVTDMSALAGQYSRSFSDGYKEAIDVEIEVLRHRLAEDLARA